MPMFPPNAVPATYVENPINQRLYEVISVKGYPVNDRGLPCRCVRCDDEQIIEVAGSARGNERAALVAEAMGFSTRDASWRLVPVVERAPVSHSS